MTDQDSIDKLNSSSYTEKDYWEGRVPDELFEEYLQMYGYEYTPQWGVDKSTNLLYTVQQSDDFLISIQ